MLQSKESLDTLKTIELFTHAPSEILSSIWDKMEEVQLSAGTVLFNAGEAGDGLYLIIEGKLGIRSGSVLIGTREPGEYVGELALLDDSPRSATVEAITDAVLLKLYREDFHQALTTSPQIVRDLLRLLVQKIRNDTQQRAAILHQQEQLQYNLRRAHEITGCDVAQRSSDAGLGSFHRKQSTGCGCWRRLLRLFRIARWARLRRNRRCCGARFSLQLVGCNRKQRLALSGGSGVGARFSSRCFEQSRAELPPYPSPHDIVLPDT